MFKLIVLAFAARILLLSSCECMSISKRGDIRICGRMLAETLNLLCEGEYYDPDDEVALSERNIHSQARGGDYFSGRYFGFPPSRMQKMDNRHPSSRISRQEVGVVDECCRQSCTLNVLRSYCRNVK